MMRIFRRAHGFESSGQIRYQVVGIFQAHVKADQGAMRLEGCDGAREARRQDDGGV